jgi:hypothetical protein
VDTVETTTPSATPLNQMIQRRVMMSRKFFWIRMRIDSRISIHAPCPSRIVLNRMLWSRLLGSH